MRGRWRNPPKDLNREERIKRGKEAEVLKQGCWLTGGIREPGEVFVLPVELLRKSSSIQVGVGPGVPGKEWMTRRWPTRAVSRTAKERGSDQKPEESPMCVEVAGRGWRRHPQRTLVENRHALGVTSQWGCGNGPGVLSSTRQRPESSMTYSADPPLRASQVNKRVLSKFCSWCDWTSQTQVYNCVTTLEHAAGEV